MSFEKEKKEKKIEPKTNVPPKPSQDKRAFLPDLFTKTVTKTSMQIKNWDFERSE